VLEQTLYSLKNFIPETVLIAAILITIMLDLIIRRKSAFVSYTGIAALLVSGYFVLEQYGVNNVFFSGMIVVDPFAVFFKFLIIVSTIFVILFTISSKEIENSTHRNEHVYLILSMALGSYLMASSVNMLMMYLSLETVSLSSYILAGYTKRIKRSSESAMKYVIYGAASSGIMIYGMSLLYGYTGTMNIEAVSVFLSGASITSNPMLVIATIMVLAGFGYKISSVPFHFWTPDVYEGAPVPVTAFLAVTSSAAGFAVLIRYTVFTYLKSPGLIDGKFQLISGINLADIIIVLSVASMIVGNFTAVWQSSVKRMLAYSSIAQGGYIMLGLAVFNMQGISAMLIYLMAYLFMTLGAFYVLVLLDNILKSDELVDMKGLAYRAPVLCVMMGIFMFALSGIPATAGFIGKFYLFSALIESNLVWLALVALMNAVVSLFFYIKVLKFMFLMKPNEEDSGKLKFSGWSYAVLLLLAVPTVFFGLYFTPIVQFAEQSAVFFGIK